MLGRQQSGLKKMLESFKLGYLAVEPKAAEMMLAKYGKERIRRLEQYKSGELPVHKQAANQDWDKLIADAKAKQENLLGPKGELPSIKQIAEKGGFSAEYAGQYTYFSDATHSGVKELEIYLEFNAEGCEVANFRYGPNDEGWLPWWTCSNRYWKRRLLIKRLS